MFEVNSENFEKEVLGYKGKLMVKFGADWCAPCKMMDKTIANLNSDIQIRIVKVDIENSPELAQKYNVSSIPYTLFLNNGEIKEKMVGIIKDKDLINIINRI